VGPVVWSTIGSRPDASGLIELIPIVERLDSDGLALGQEETEVSDRSVQPAQFGRFMTTIFDESVRNDVGCATRSGRPPRES
jgi:sulfatase maturation enzyme AslB (radical SAM superfamily)